MTNIFGNTLLPSQFGTTGVLVLDPETSMSGNTVVRAGIPNRDGSWTQSLHIVLTPTETDALIAELQHLRAASQ